MPNYNEKTFCGVKVYKSVDDIPTETSSDIPKSFILYTEEKNDSNNNNSSKEENTKICFSPLSSSALLGRSENNHKG